MSPAAALDRKFDLLTKSGACPSYLLEVLTLLVAHAKDTELFKHELRSAPFDEVIPPLATGMRAVTAGEATDGAALEKESLPSQANVIRPPESSLHAHAADLKKLNDVALATSSKALRQMKESTSADMIAFRDGVVRKTIDQTRDELDSLRMSWLQSLDSDVARIKKELHQMQLATQKELHHLTEACGDYMEKGFELLNVKPLLDAHRAVGESSLCAERLCVLERRAMTRADADALCGRVEAVERAVARLGGRDASSRGSPPSRPQHHRQQTPVEPQCTEDTPLLTTSTADAWGPTLLGLSVRDGGDEVEGVVVAHVVPDSLADVVHLTPGCIISRVGRTAVSTCTEFTKAVNLAGSAVRLTVYDPQTAKVCIVTIQR